MGANVFSGGNKALLDRLRNASFGGLLTIEPTTVFQQVYISPKISPNIVTNTFATGTISQSDQKIQLSCGVGLFGYAAIRSKKFIRYNPGRASMIKFTAIFDNNAVANSLQLAGYGNAESGFYIGYDGVKFGVARQTGGRLEIRTFDITTASSTAESVTIELNGVNFTVAVTASGDINTTAAEIAAGTFTGWTALATDSEVHFVKNGTGVANGSYSLTATTAVATITQDQAGVANSFNWFYQDSNEVNTWNFNGSKGLDFSLDPTQGNIYRITFGYLGFDDILWEVKSPVSQKFIPIHLETYINENTETNAQDPAVQGLFAVASLGSTTNLTIQSGSMEGSIQGKPLISGIPGAASNAQGAIATDAKWYNVLTIRVDNVIGSPGSHKSNRTQIKLREASCSFAGGAKPGEVAIFLNADLAGTNVFTAIDSDSVVSCSKNKVEVTNGSVWDSKAIQKEGVVDFDFWNADFFLESGDTLTLATKISLGGATPDASGTFSWKEDS